MELPYRVLWMEEGGYIARYSFSTFGQVRPNLEPVADTLFDSILQSIEDPDKQVWAEPGEDDPELAYFRHIDESRPE